MTLWEALAPSLGIGAILLAVWAIYLGKKSLDQVERYNTASKELLDKITTISNVTFSIDQRIAQKIGADLSSLIGNVSAITTDNSDPYVKQPDKPDAESKK